MALQDIYTSASPYYNTTVDLYYLDVMVNRPIPKYLDDPEIVLTNTYEYRPDLLANDLYGDSQLWWVFAQRNPNTLVDPLMDFRTGAKIFVPLKRTLEEALGI